MGSDEASRSEIISIEDRLRIFADTLSLSEQRILQAIIATSVDPIERMRLRDVRSILSEDEIKVLNKLLSKRAKVG
jgi:hypothetical protein